MSLQKITLAAAVLACLMSATALVRSNGIDKEALKATLAADPGIIMSALQKMRQQQGDDGKKSAKAAFEKYKDSIYTDAAAPAMGNLTHPDVTIVEFFDYHCGYCKRMLPTLTQLVQNDKGVRIILRDFPILSEDSALAAKAAIAVHAINPGKYFEFHSALMNAKGKFDEKFLFDTAQKLGISTDKLKKQMADKSTEAALAKNHQMAQDFGVRGTPALLIGDQMLPGALPYDDLKTLVDAARKEKK